MEIILIYYIELFKLKSSFKNYDNKEVKKISAVDKNIEKPLFIFFFTKLVETERSTNWTFYKLNVLQTERSTNWTFYKRAV